MIDFLLPTWPAPANIRALTTLRTFGDLTCETTRIRLKKEFNLNSEPVWLQQKHGTIALPALPENRGKEGDAAFADKPGQICVVLTADCLPLLISDRKGTRVAAIHAGWRGLLNGVIESTLHALNSPPEDLLVWLGPAIGPKRFEVGDDVRDPFIRHHAKASEAFTPSTNQKWLADLYALARLRLNESGITAIFGGEYCTFSDEKRFFSYRRDNQVTGRLASLIWIDQAI